MTTTWKNDDECSECRWECEQLHACIRAGQLPRDTEYLGFQGPSLLYSCPCCDTCVAYDLPDDRVLALIGADGAASVGGAR